MPDPSRPRRTAMYRFALVSSVLCVLVSEPRVALAQFLVQGRVVVPRHPGDASELPPDLGLPRDYFAGGGLPVSPRVLALDGVRCFASRDGAGSEALAFRTWSTAPVGWFRLSGVAGRYSFLFTGPSVCMRPYILANVLLEDGDSVDLRIRPRFDLAVFDDSGWDPRKAAAYCQLFTARGTSLTQVGFKLASDGVDGEGPGSRTILVSVHRPGFGPPSAWERIGPVVPIFGVDSGGVKNSVWTAAWDSLEVPLRPGESYAVLLRCEEESGGFQAFWSARKPGDPDSLRLALDGNWEASDRVLWMAVGSDADGLLISCQKRVQKEYGEFAGFARCWTQTWVPRGRSLAGVVLYAATGGSQPGIHRQRVLARVRRGGPAGPVLGVEKIAVGTGIHTGDASWGTFGAVFAPGELPLDPGVVHALEFETLETPDTLADYVNIKGVASDRRPGFNPYRRHAADAYEYGEAWKNGTDRRDFDLDLQIIEYEHSASEGSKALEAEDLLDLGGSAEARWTSFATEAGTIVKWTEDPGRPGVRVLRVLGETPQAALGGGAFRKVEGLKRSETYRLRGRVRATWPADVDRAVDVGVDPTGEAEDPSHPAIRWTVFPAVHGLFVECDSGPVRPRKDALGLWLRARAKGSPGFPFRAEFDGFTLERVATGAPRPGGTPR